MLKNIQNWANKNEGFITFIGVILTLGGWILPELTKWLPSSVAPKVLDIIRRYNIFAISIGIILLVLALVLELVNQRKRLLKIEEKIQILENLPVILLEEPESSNLSNWSYRNGQWTSDQDGLSVTKSGLGGIYNLGATWENYEFSFEFKIISQCAGWIVRARDDNHYVMVQCNKEQVCPHIFTVSPKPDRKSQPGFQVINKIDHNLSLQEWNRARTEVIGHGIKVWINETLVWSDSELLKDFSMGTVGFRCSHNEHALFRYIKVVRK
jgi:hypothetical protein